MGFVKHVAAFIFLTLALMISPGWGATITADAASQQSRMAMMEKDEVNPGNRIIVYEKSGRIVEPIVDEVISTDRVFPLAVKGLSIEDKSAAEVWLSNIDKIEIGQTVYAKESTSEIDCQISAFTLDAINRATETAIEDDDISVEALELINQAEEIAGPPECDSLRAGILLDRAIRLSEKTPNLNRETAKSSALILMFDVARMSFGDDIFSGFVPQLGLTLGYAFNPGFEIGYTYSSSLIFSPTLDKGSAPGNLGSVSTSMQMLYLRGNLPISKNVIGFALIGHSQIETEAEKFRVCLFFCGGLITTSSTTTYRNRQAGFAWGLGLQVATRNPNVSWLLQYVNYSDTGFEFNGIHLGYRGQFPM